MTALWQRRRTSLFYYSLSLDPPRKDNDFVMPKRRNGKSCYHHLSNRMNQLPDHLLLYLQIDVFVNSPHLQPQHLPICVILLDYLSRNLSTKGNTFMLKSTNHNHNTLFLSCCFPQLTLLQYVSLFTMCFYYPSVCYFNFQIPSSLLSTRTSTILDIIIII